MPWQNLAKCFGKKIMKTKHDSIISHNLLNTSFTITFYSIQDNSISYIKNVIKSLITAAFFFNLEYSKFCGKVRYCMVTYELFYYKIYNQDQYFFGFCTLFRLAVYNKINTSRYYKFCGCYNI